MRYKCEDDGYIAKQIESIVIHLQNIHSINCKRIEGKGRRGGGELFCCEQKFRDRILFFNHIGKRHKVSITYIRGLTNKKAYLNGVHYQTI